jgi:hypothetical protein
LGLSGTIAVVVSNAASELFTRHNARLVPPVAAAAIGNGELTGYRRFGNVVVAGALEHRRSTAGRKRPVQVREELPMSEAQRKPSRRAMRRTPTPRTDSLRRRRAGDPDNQPHSYGSEVPPRGWQRQGEHTAAGREVDRAKEQPATAEDLAGEPMREGDNGDSGAAGESRPAGVDSMPEELEALGDMPLGAEDDQKRPRER